MTPRPAAGTTSDGGRVSLFHRSSEYLGLLAVLALVIGVFGLKTETFFTAATFRSIANEVPALAVVAVGMTFVIITAGIDLSVGSVLALAGALLGLAMVDWGWSWPGGVTIALLGGLACGVANGWVTVRFAVPSFIVTLGMMQIARGLAYLTTDSQTKYVGQPIEWLREPLPLLGLSSAFVIALVVVAVGQIVLTHTLFGRYVFVIGANEETARYSGVNPRPIKIAVFVIAGALAGLGAAFNTSILGAVDPNAGNGLELAAIAAVVIGGTSLMGGRGSVVNSFIGVLIMATLGAGLAQVGAKEWVKLVITGVVIVIAVILDAWRAERMKGGGGREPRRS